MAVTYIGNLVTTSEYYNRFSQSIASAQSIEDNLILVRGEGGITETVSLVDPTNLVHSYTLIHHGITRSAVIRLLLHYKTFKEHPFRVFIKSANQYVRCIYTKAPTITLINTVLADVEISLIELGEYSPPVD